MRSTVQFIPDELRLEILFANEREFPHGLLTLLLTERIANDVGVKRRPRSVLLCVILHNSQGLPPLNLLERLAYRLSRLPGRHGVYDPWKHGISNVNLKLALSLIGNVFRTCNNQQSVA